MEINILKMSVMVNENKELNRYFRLKLTFKERVALFSSSKLTDMPKCVNLLEQTLPSHFVFFVWVAQDSS